MRSGHGVTWAIVGMGLVGAALGLPAGLADASWSTTASGMLLAVGSLPRLWNGFTASDRPPAPTRHLLAWNLAMSGVVSLIVLAAVRTSRSELRAGVALAGVAALVLLVSTDLGESRLRRARTRGVNLP